MRAITGGAREGWGWSKGPVLPYAARSCGLKAIQYPAYSGSPGSFVTACEAVPLYQRLLTLSFSAACEARTYLVLRWKAAGSPRPYGTRTGVGSWSQDCVLAWLGLGLGYFRSAPSGRTWRSPSVVDRGGRARRD